MWFCIIVIDHSHIKRNCFMDWHLEVSLCEVLDCIASYWIAPKSGWTTLWGEGFLISLLLDLALYRVTFRHISTVTAVRLWHILLTSCSERQYCQFSWEIDTRSVLKLWMNHFEPSTAPLSPPGLGKTNRIKNSVREGKLATPWWQLKGRGRLMLTTCMSDNDSTLALYTQWRHHS
jgi:hypothetical protein